MKVRAKPNSRPNNQAPARFAVNCKRANFYFCVADFGKGVFFLAIFGVAEGVAACRG
jgi:hypothetical protein